MRTEQDRDAYLHMLVVKVCGDYCAQNTSLSPASTAAQSSKPTEYSGVVVVWTGPHCSTCDVGSTVVAFPHSLDEIRKRRSFVFDLIELGTINT